MSTRGKAFADALERCIRNTAEEILTTAPHWSDRCDTPGRKVSYQAERLSLTLSPLRSKYGYGPTLWCAFYSAYMPGGWPYDHAQIANGATYGYEAFMCPRDRRCSAHELANLGEHEEIGVRHEGGNSKRYNLEMFSASCALCRELRERLGTAPPFWPTPWSWVEHDERFERMRDGWINQWDIHPFGEWYSADVWPAQRHDPALMMEIISIYRITNGEDLRGFLWGSLALLGRHFPKDDPLEWVAKACESSFRLDAYVVRGEASNECAHGAGHTALGCT